MSVPELLMRRFTSSIGLYRFKKAFRKKFPGTYVNPMNIFDLSKVSVGNYSYGELNVMMWKSENNSLTIGRFVSIAPDVTFILGGNHLYTTISTYPFSDFIVRDKADKDLSKGPVIVQDDVWIGAKSIILSGVTLGQGSIIGTGSLVTKDVPPYAIVGGNPARVIKYRFPENLIEILIRKIDYGNLTEERIKNNLELLRKPVEKDSIEQYISIFN